MATFVVQVSDVEPLGVGLRLWSSRVLLPPSVKLRAALTTKQLAARS